MANNLTYAVTVNSDSTISYPQDLITKNNIATWAGGIFSDSIKFGSFDYLEGEGSPLVPNDRSTYTEITNERIKIASYKYGSDESSSMLFGTRLSLGNGTIVLDGDNGSYDANFTISHNSYTSDFNLFCGKTSSYEYGAEYGIGELSMSNNGRGIKFADGVYNFAENSLTYDPLGMSLKFTNPELNVTQAPIYGFTSTDLSSNVNKDYFVYTAKAVEDRLASISSTGGETFTGGIIPNPIKIGEFNEDGTPVDRRSYAVLSPTLLHVGDYGYGSDYEGTDIKPHKISLYADYNSYDCNINMFAQGDYSNSSKVSVQLGAYGNDTDSVYSMFSMSDVGGYGKFDFTDLAKIEEIDDYGTKVITYNDYCGFKAIGLKFDNNTDGIGTQQRIYAFLSNNIDYATNATKNGTVYTVKGVEDYIKNCGFVKSAQPGQNPESWTATVGYSDITSTGYVQAFTRGSDDEGIRVLGNDLYYCEKSVATIGSGNCPMDYDFYDNTGSYGNNYHQAYVSVASDSGANIVIADNKIQLPVYNQDGTLAKNGNTQEYIAIKAVKDATTGTVSLVVMQ